jgi:hypothetical protein
VALADRHQRAADRVDGVPEAGEGRPEIVPEGVREEAEGEREQHHPKREGDDEDERREHR